MTLFATHYHEITDLARTYKEIQNAHMAIQEQGHEIRFLYTLKKGPANKSYGIQVARLAGLPTTVVDRAQTLLKSFESSRTAGRLSQSGHEHSQQLPLLAFAESPVDTEKSPEIAKEDSHEVSVLSAREREFLEKIKAFKTSDQTPLAALNQIAQWQQDMSQL